MRYLMLSYGDESSEAGEPPSEELMEKMGALVQEALDAGVMEKSEGLQPSSQGMKVRWENGKLHVTDGPFTESKEVIASYAIMNCKDHEEALYWSTRFYELLGAGSGEIRPIEQWPE